jgi:hypothetical protein
MDGNRIKHITPEGITYLDDEGNEQFIDFAACYANYVKQKTSPEYWERIKQLNNFTDADWERYVQRIKSFKEIGNRNVLEMPWADGPYIEFHTDPPIRFKFDTQEEYRKVISAIRHTDWITFDQS